MAVRWTAKSYIKEDVMDILFAVLGLLFIRLVVPATIILAIGTWMQRHSLQASG